MSWSLGLGEVFALSLCTCPDGTPQWAHGGYFPCPHLREGQYPFTQLTETDPWRHFPSFSPGQLCQLLTGLPVSNPAHTHPFLPVSREDFLNPRSGISSPRLFCLKTKGKDEVWSLWGRSCHNSLPNRALFSDYKRSK